MSQSSPETTGVPVLSRSRSDRKLLKIPIPARPRASALPHSDTGLSGPLPKSVHVILICSNGIGGGWENEIFAAVS